MSYTTTTTTSSTSSPRTATATPSTDLCIGEPPPPPSIHATSDYGSSEGNRVQQCVRCLHYGHDRCRRRPRCFRCGSFEHTDSSICINPVMCLNCGDSHDSKHEGCPSRLRELTIQQLVHKQGLSRKEAVQMAASFGVVTTRLKSVAVQTDPPPVDAATQTDYGSLDYGCTTTNTSMDPQIEFWEQQQQQIPSYQQPIQSNCYPSSATYSCYCNAVQMLLPYQTSQCPTSQMHWRLPSSMEYYTLY